MKTEIFSAKYYVTQMCEDNLIESVLINHFERKQYSGSLQLLGYYSHCDQKVAFGDYGIQEILEDTYYSQKLCCSYIQVYIIYPSGIMNSISF